MAPIAIVTLLPCCRQACPLAETYAVKTLPARRRPHPIRRARDPVVRHGLNRRLPREQPVLETNAVAGRDQRVRVARVRVQRLANHHSRLRPRVRGRQAVDTRGDLAVTAQLGVDETKLVLRSPNVGARRADRIDTVRGARGASRCHLTDVDRGRRHSRQMRTRETDKQLPIEMTSFRALQSLVVTSRGRRRPDRVTSEPPASVREPHASAWARGAAPVGAVLHFFGETSRSLEVGCEPTRRFFCAITVGDERRGGMRKRLSASCDSCARRTALLRPAETKDEAVGLTAHGGVEHALAEIVGGVAQQVALRLEHETGCREVAFDELRVDAVERAARLRR